MIDFFSIILITNTILFLSFAYSRLKKSAKTHREIHNHKQKMKINTIIAEKVFNNNHTNNQTENYDGHSFEDVLKSIQGDKKLSDLINSINNDKENKYIQKNYFIFWIIAILSVSILSVFLALAKVN